jgi:hypothetical protein
LNNNNDNENESSIGSLNSRKKSGSINSPHSDQENNHNNNHNDSQDIVADNDKQLRKQNQNFEASKETSEQLDIIRSLL